MRCDNAMWITRGKVVFLQVTHLCKWLWISSEKKRFHGTSSSCVYHAVNIIREREGVKADEIALETCAGAAIGVKHLVGRADAAIRSDGVLASVAALSVGRLALVDIYSSEGMRVKLMRSLNVDGREWESEERVVTVLAQVAGELSLAIAHGRSVGRRALGRAAAGIRRARYDFLPAKLPLAVARTMAVVSRTHVCCWMENKMQLRYMITMR